MKVKYRRRRTARKILSAVLILALAAGGLTLLWRWYDSNVDRSGWVEKDGVLSYKDFHGKRVTGWLHIGEVTYYFGEDHAMVTGWQDIDTHRYCFGDDGILLTGWQTLGENRYYLGADGRMRTGWQDIEGTRYYLGTDGAAASGWADLGEDRYYLEEGVPVTSWQDIGGNRYFFSKTGKMCVGWRSIDNHAYYFREDGTPMTGKVTLEGKNYRFGEDGILYTGWQDLPEGRTYYHSDGAQAIGWAEIEGKRYYFDENGIMLTGWLQDGEYSYYLQEDGSAAVGPKKMDGYTYYFTPKGIHVVLVNAANPVPGYYKMNLVTVTGWHQVSDVCLDALVKMLADCNAAGIQYNFNSAHRTIEEQTMILELRTEEHMEAGLSYEAARAKALQTVAYPGTSEHHLGLAVDLLGDKAVAWLTEHCWDYGFIVRYTADKYAITGIVNEPWHFRYVGTEVSLDMKDSGLCLEEYLGAA